MLVKQTERVQKKEVLPDWNLVRSFFVARGDSVHAWAERNGLSPEHTYMAARGLRRGPKALAIVRRLREEAGL